MKAALFLFIMNKFISFTTDINSLPLPNKFDYPHNYIPHPLAKTAANELQAYLKKQTDFIHNFGLNNQKYLKSEPLGKMFGVLVVKNKNGELGYLAAFSGKINNSTLLKNFVPPVYNVLSENGCYLKTEEQLNQINSNLSDLKNNTVFLKTEKKYLNIRSINNNLLENEKVKIKKRRKARKQQSVQSNQQNINEEFYLREYEVYLNTKIHPIKKEYTYYQQQIQQLQEQRKKLSARVQQEIFKNYQFLNSKKEAKNLLAIFKSSKQNIPAGAGDCCAPKLLQYAFLNNLTPICMAEFWWGKSLTTSIRKHQNFYAACTGKCKPILKHMLQGLSVDKNPVLLQLQSKTAIKIIFEDNYLAVIHKPNGLLSVPGKEIEDSVYSRIKKLYPTATGSLIVHRLDMSTSGILLIAKNASTHKHLQAQFINKTIKKRYVALLDGVLDKNKGEINLPLRVDLNDRPKQLVCYEHGKLARTNWKIIEVKNNKTRIHLYPITGRTHQLRVHAAHNLGLNTPILGDDLYGVKADRLYLHAEKITFIHPKTAKQLSFISPTPF